MSRWFRFYDEAINDPKILRLSDAQFRAWVTLLCISSKNDGVLPSTNDIALVLRMKPQKVAEWLATLTAAGLLDNDNGLFSPHNWNARQFKSDKDPTAAERQRRKRERDDVTRDVTGASRVVSHPPETEQRQRQRQRQIQSRERTRASALAPGWSEDDRNQFWERFPNKVGKADAMKAFDKATRKVSPDVLFPALQRYANKTDDRPFCNPATWLNQERWLDQPAANHGRRTVQQAADDLLAKIHAFDEPAPVGLRDGTGENSIRLIPSDRRE